MKPGGITCVLQTRERVKHDTFTDFLHWHFTLQGFVFWEMLLSKKLLDIIWQYSATVRPSYTCN
jgi:hypothetical protein